MVGAWICRDGKNSLFTDGNINFLDYSVCMYAYYDIQRDISMVKMTYDSKTLTQIRFVGGSPMCWVKFCHPYILHMVSWGPRHRNNKGYVILIVLYILRIFVLIYDTLYLGMFLFSISLSLTLHCFLLNGYVTCTYCAKSALRQLHVIVM